MIFWTNAETDRLFDIVENSESQRKGFEEASRILNKTYHSCRKRFQRTNKTWVKGIPDNPEISSIALPPTVFIKNKQGDLWSKDESQTLYHLKVDKNYTYKQIAKFIKRSPKACERHFQRRWVKNNRLAKPNNRSVKANDNENIEQQIAITDSIAEWLVAIVEYNPSALEALTEEVFYAKLNRVLENEDSKIKPTDIFNSFKEIKQLAFEKIDNLGLTYPKKLTLGEGRYLIVGESHGKNTSSGTFSLLRTLNKHLKCTNIIHHGHAFDDDDEMSYHWTSFDNLIVLSMLNELQLFKKQNHKYNVIKEEIKLGDVCVRNQYDSTDFSKKYIGGIDPLTIPTNVIVNSHRHELHSHCKYNEERFVMSAGCLCRRHVIRTIKMLVFKNGKPHVRQTHPFGYKKYNKQQQDNLRWEQGVVLAEVDKEGFATCHPLRIKDTKEGKTTAFAGKIYTELDVIEPDQKIFINADLHCRWHDPEILDMQDQFCQNYKPDIHVNLGDMIDGRSFNHHMKGTQGPAFYKNQGQYVFQDFLEEVASVRYILMKMRSWAKASHLVIGNHERFIDDLVSKFPQLQNIFNVDFLFGIKDMEIKTTSLLKTLDMEHTKFIHGDIRIWGGAGSLKLDKVSNNYGRDTVMGNIHYPAIRSGCYSIPMTGKLEQGYNESEASQWMQGFGYADVFDNTSFVSIIISRGKKCMVDKKTYVPRNPEKWIVPEYSAKLNFSFC